SRRRHTRSKRDWSSDVCSSDLPVTLADHGAVGEGDRGDVAVEEAGGDGGFGALLGADSVLILGLAGDAAQLGDVLRGLAHQDVRSEERRVGRGWRARG